MGGGGGGGVTCFLSSLMTRFCTNYFICTYHEFSEIQLHHAWMRQLGWSHYLTIITCTFYIYIYIYIFFFFNSSLQLHITICKFVMVQFSLSKYNHL